MKIFISAGEASGDALGARLLEALLARHPDIDAFGMGGAQMRELGFRGIRDSNEFGVVGLVEVIRHLPRLFRLKDELADAAIEEQPDVAVLIDVPDFNIRLAQRLKSAGIKVVFYVGPSVWAWRAGRAKRYARWIDKLLVLFPFELPIWRSHGVDVECVGHPLLDEIPAAAPMPSPSTRTIALLPGSRRSEIRRHLDTILAAAAKLKAESVADRFVLPVAPSVDVTALAETIERSEAKGAVELVTGGASARREAIRSADLALVASGTATLETALVGRPQVIFYRLNWLTWILGKPFAKVAWFGLVNLIVNREVAPELLQGRFTVAGLVAAARRVLESPEEALRGNAEVRAALGDGDAASRAADAVLEVLRDSARTP